MQAQIIPLLVVNDVSANIEYLEKCLGFSTHRLSDGGEFAVMVYRGAFLMIESRRLYASSRKMSFGEGAVGLGTETLIKVSDVEYVYNLARNNGAEIARAIHSVAETAEFNIRRFSVSLPDGYLLTFFDYVHAEWY
jgi:uncharacterized glyoxalase superfamily protein PhnB